MLERFHFLQFRGKEDFDRAKELVDAWDEKFASLNPDTYAKSDFMTFYNNFIGEYATLWEKRLAIM